MHVTGTHFTDRTDAGRQLAALLGRLRGPGTVVVALPRGGVPVAAEVAAALGAPLDICVIRKLGVPYQPELGMGAIGEDGVRVLNDQVLRPAGVTARQLADVESRERVELERRARRYRGDRPPADLRGRTVVVVDDGIATGSTARAACLIVRARGAARVVLAVPVAPDDWTDRLDDVADELVCVGTPSPFFAIGEFYADFRQTEDTEVLRRLAEAGARAEARAEARAGTPVGAVPRAAAGPDRGVEPDSTDPTGTTDTTDRELTVAAGGVRLTGRLTVPAGARGIVVFAHGSGSSRRSPRNRYVADYLNRSGLATFLFDLLTEDEEPDRRNVFDVDLLGARLTDVAGHLPAVLPARLSAAPSAGPPGRDGPADGIPLGLFGASTGAAAALWTAARLGDGVRAVVSRGGRPDLAGAGNLGRVTAPTLLIVGSRDGPVIDLNRRARELLRCESEVAVVPNAGHLFEEPGTLDRVAELARVWFVDHFAPA
ncbi:phosphoribosyltransferase family protein [Streptomyces sp. BE20]|uniref:phosphoribosyltransferase family protein n=1 Tax=Streptomyces sp. BE20 TaxID=3002525 RepID=UPI002E760B9F|nr:phosphoribosyltransferase family protein [Streptomyces sp. BE20]MEE1823629.1 phosphoribosyltransferase family protein [Streptomyces sp. BE20]